MKKSVAAGHLKVYAWSLQRYRGEGSEILGPGSAELCFTDEEMARLWPWIWGDKCPLIQLTRVLDRYDESGELAPGDYFNFMTILLRLTPELIPHCQLLASYWRDREEMGGVFPFPDDVSPRVMGGWDED